MTPYTSELREFALFTDWLALCDRLREKNLHYHSIKYCVSPDDTHRFSGTVTKLTFLYAVSDKPKFTYHYSHFSYITLNTASDKKPVPYAGICVSVRNWRLSNTSYKDTDCRGRRPCNR